MTATSDSGIKRHRPAPQQARARATVAKIQEAAKDILVESGPHGLNTNLIAERAGVNVATLYNYYPDKFAVLVHLFGEFEEQRASYVREQFELLGPDTDLAEWTNAIVDRLAEMRTSGGYQIALRRALVSVPELAGLDRDSISSISKGLEGALVRTKRWPAGAPLGRVADLVVEVITNTLDAALVQTPADFAKIAELKVMVNAYLLASISGPRPVASE